MENPTAAAAGEETNPNDDLIFAFSEITSTSREEALFYLESHNFNLDSALSTYLETDAPLFPAPAMAADRHLPPPRSLSPSLTSPQSSSPSRSRSPSPPPSLRSQTNPYSLRSRQPPASSSSNKKPAGARSSGIRTISDLNRQPTDSDSDDPQEYYTGGEKSGMLVQDPSKVNDVNAIFKKAREGGAVERPDHVITASSTTSFVGTGRLLSGETVSHVPQPPEVVTYNITFWSDGFTVDDGPLRKLDDPENAPFLESIKKSECPRELEPADRRTQVQVNLMRKEQNHPEPERVRVSFVGMGRTLGSTSSSNTSAVPAVAATSLSTAPPPSPGLVVNSALPSTSIQLRLVDGTRMVSRFNCHHTIREIRSFIDASRPNNPRTYQLQTVGFPPKQLNDLEQTIEQAGLANSVVIQKL